MNLFDIEVIKFVNQYSQSYWFVDSVVRFISSNQLLKGGALMMVFWWGWFRVGEDQILIRKCLISTLFGCFIAMVLARSLALLLPFRTRPLHEETLSFVLPHGMPPTALDGWSSFPSDHAVLFYTLSIGMFCLSKKIGLFSIVYTTLLIALPRVYLGLHYPTDIIVGALIGMVVVYLCQHDYFVENVSQPVVVFSNVRPEVFYPLLFLVTYQVADLFNDSRSLVSFLSSTLKAILSS